MKDPSRLCSPHSPLSHTICIPTFHTMSPNPCVNNTVTIHSFYLTLSLSSFPLPPPLLPGFLQCSIFKILLKLTSFLQMGCSMGHCFTPLASFYFKKKKRKMLLLCRCSFILDEVEATSFTRKFYCKKSI